MQKIMPVTERAPVSGSQPASEPLTDMRPVADSHPKDGIGRLSQAGIHTQAGLRPQPGLRPQAGFRPHNAPLAVLLVVLATTCFAFLDATAKYLVGVAHLPVAQVVWVRFMGQLLAIVAVLGLVSVPRLFNSTKPLLQLLRSCLLVGATVGNFLAMRELRLDQTVSIVFLGPLILALLAGPLLGEWVGWRRLIAIAVGFLGILIVVRPGFGSAERAMLYSFGGMLSYVGFMMLTRVLTAQDAPAVTLFYSLLAGAVLFAPAAISGWMPPPSTPAALGLVAVGIYAAIGHYFFILANRYAPASTVAPFSYFQLLVMITLGFLIFGDRPDVWTLLGSTIVIGAGIYLVHRERVVGKAKAASASLTPSA